MANLHILILRSIIVSSSVLILLSFSLVFPNLFSRKGSYNEGQYLTQILLSKEAALDIQHNTGHIPSTAYEVNIFQYCQYNLINSTYSSPNSTHEKPQFYPVKSSNFLSFSKKRKNNNLSSLFSAFSNKVIDHSSYKCHWAFPSPANIFDPVDLFGVPVSEHTLPEELVLHHTRFERYSRCLPFLLVCFVLTQFYMIRANQFKLVQLRRQDLLPVHKGGHHSKYHTPNHQSRYSGNTITVMSILSALLIVLLVMLDLARDKHLFHLISEFYTSKQAPIYVFPKSAASTNLLTWMSEISILLIPICVISKLL
ncbi:Hypothetical protein, no similarity [Geotrichum candidum]|uniref:Uncharacterized protein n=1 Tax=Geotrichum candidum TaxID=1173061 RepID=A0A0J9XIZ1_GEOCN|nr:Hypothetical protein, no similarity [Geotrichum candidum]